jgi:iron complex outermembrane receptor protein
VHSAGYCLPYAVGLLSSANPAIKPEKSDSYTLGAIFEPLTNLSASVDFYAIKKTNVIVPPSTFPALVAYLNGQPLPPGDSITPDLPDPAFPTSLIRPLIAGGLYANQNALQTDGVDLDLRGKFDISRFGAWISDLSLTKIFSYKVIFANGTSNQYVGTQAPYILSSGAGTPRYRGTWSNTYQYGPASATLSAYYVSGFQETGIDATGSSTACLYNTTFCHVASFLDFDLTGIYHVTDHFAANVTIQNLFDRLPPIDPADYAGTNYNPTYAQAGIIGRFFKVGVSYKF